MAIYEWLLDKESKRKLALFRSIEENDGLSEESEVLMENLELSDFLLKKTVNELNSDFEKLNLKGYFQVRLEGSKVSLKEKGLATSEFLESAYIKESIAFNLLQTIFFQKFISVNDYAMEHYMSYPIVYKELKKLRDKLSQLDIVITKKFQFEGSEWAIRQFFYVLYFKVHKDSFDFYPKNSVSYSEQLIETIQEMYAIKLSAQSLVKFKHYLCITQYRAGQFNVESQKKDAVILDYNIFDADEIQQIQDTPFISNISKEELLTQNETILILLFLLIEGYISDKSNANLQEIPKVKQLSKHFIEALAEQFNLNKKKIMETNIFEPLNKIHYKSYLLDYFKYYTSKQFNMYYFQQNYGLFFDFCKTFINSCKENRRYKKIWENRVSLFYEYLFVLIDYIPLALIAPPVHIYIDFSLGKFYNEYIKKNIFSFDTLNVVVDSYIGKKTSLILTDYLMDKFQKEIDCIVWLSPPRAVDWANFATKVIEIRQEK